MYSRGFQIFIAMLIGVFWLAGCAGDSSETTPAPPADEPAQSQSGEASQAVQTESGEADEPAQPQVEEEVGFSADLPPVELASAPEMRTFVLVPSESRAMYIAREELFQGALEKYGLALGNATVTGTTEEVEGILQLDLEAEAPLGANRIAVYLPSLTTEQNQRDEWLRENALESERYPLAVFTASEIQGAPETYTEGEEVTFQLLGEMTIREITNPLTFAVTASLEGDTIRGSAEADTLITDWGFEPPTFAGTLAVENELTLRIEFVAREESN